MPNATKLKQQQNPPASKAGRHPARRQAEASGPEPTGRAIDAASVNSHAPLTPEQRRELIATWAYHRAELRGFSGGSPEQDWLEAEAELDAGSASSAGVPRGGNG